VVRGGPQDGLCLSYVDIDPAAVTVVENSQEDRKHGSLPDAKLRLRLRDGRAIELADIIDYGEERIVLEELRAILVTLATPQRDLTPELPRDAAILSCDNCGNLVVPADSATVTCHCCQDSVYIPEAVRYRIASQRTLAMADQKTQALVHQLLNQPRVGVVNTLLVVYWFVFVVTAFASVWGLGHHSISLSFVSYAVMHGCYLLIRLKLSHRIGFRTLAFSGSFARIVGGVSLPACRNCGALLPASDPKQALSHCAYCGQVSVLNIDLPWYSSEVANALFNVEKALATVKDTHDRCVQRFVGVAVVFVIFGFVLFVAPPS